MQLVPLKPVPSQLLNVSLGNQQCQLKVYERFYGLYVDLYVNNALVIGGVKGENLNRVVRSLYLGFTGDFVFADAQGSDDPSYDGLGSRFFLFYLTTADLAALGLTG